MGKNTDKLYITQSEHSGAEGRHGASTGITHRKISAKYKKLPYYYCSLSLQPWEFPVCVVNDNKVATVFDLATIVPWLQSKGTNPTTGKPLDPKDLIKLVFSKNDEDEYCDPITKKIFNDHTHIVAIASTGNVFAYETITTLNYKAKNLVDLVSDEPFTRSDVVTIQDPHDLATDDLSQATPMLQPDHHVSPQMRSSSNAVFADKEKRVEDARAAIDRLRKKPPDRSQIDSSRESSIIEKKAQLPYNAANYSTGYTAASFTSTGMTVKTADDRALLTEEQYLLHPKKIKTKALGIIRTTHGNMDIELWPEHAPKAVYNFVKLAKSGYYNGVIFHRNIPGFMVQGGDPSGRGTGGRSIFGKNFEDEISPAHSHSKRGLISMANKGPGTNSSQFFITYDSARHLDKKHTIFGQIIGGDDVLDRLERVPVVGDKPKSRIEMTEVQILLDPFDDFLEKEKQRRETDLKKRESTEDDYQTWTNQPVKTLQNRAASSPSLGEDPKSVGKYLKGQDSRHEHVISKRPSEHIETSSVQKKVKKTGFGDFSAW